MSSTGGLGAWVMRRVAQDRGDRVEVSLVVEERSVGERETELDQIGKALAVGARLGHDVV